MKLRLILGIGIGIGMVFVMGLVAALAFPILRKRQGEAQQGMERRLEALKLKSPLTDAEKATAMAFGQQLAKDLRERDIAKVTAAVDLQTLMDRLFAPLNIGHNIGEFRSGFVKGYNSNPGGIFSSFIGSEVRCLKVTSRDGFPAVMLRSTDENNGIVFFDVLVRIDAKGVKAVDLFNYLFASFVTTDGREMIASTMAKDEGNAVLSLLRWPTRNRAKLDALTGMATSMRLGRQEVVIADYKALPADWQRERPFFLLYFRTLMSISEPKPEMKQLFKQAFIDAPQILGKDSVSELMQVDMQMMDGDFAGAERGLSQAEGTVGRDAYLTAMRSLMELKQHKVDEAARLRNEALALEPGLPMLASLGWMILATQKNYKGLVDEFKTLRLTHNKVVTRSDLVQPEFADFLISPEFAQWEAQNRAP